MAPDRILTVEEGARDVRLIGARQSKEGPVGLRFTENNRPAGAMRFSFFSANSLFKVESVVDAACRPVSDHANISRGGDGRVLQTWDTLRVRLGGRAYELSLGYDAGVISVTTFVRVTP